MDSKEICPSKKGLKNWFVAPHICGVQHYHLFFRFSPKDLTLSIGLN